MTGLICGSEAGYNAAFFYEIVVVVSSPSVQSDVTYITEENRM
jgi:hypothetical protein